MKDNLDDIFNLIYETAQNGVFEIWYEESDTTKIYIPYMMNDALECYVVLNSALLVGNQLEEYKNLTEIEIHKEVDRYALIAKQSDFNTFTVFFEDAKLVKKYYRFDTICHFWEKGQEQWAQLVYIVGTMYDKFAFLGAESCNEIECELLPLIEYAPFRAHAPAKQLFEELYDTTRKGIRLMMKYAFAAKDYSFWIMNIVYLIFKTDVIARYLSVKLTKPNRYKLYDYIYRKCMKGAGAYPERTLAVVQMRNDINDKMLNLGLIGDYPDYYGKNVLVRIVEEHPFTIMDWADFKLKNTLMVTEVNKEVDVKRRFNYGFFEHKVDNVKGYICSIDEFEDKYKKLR